MCFLWLNTTLRAGHMHTLLVCTSGLPYVQKWDFQSFVRMNLFFSFFKNNLNLVSIQNSFKQEQSRRLKDLILPAGLHNKICMFFSSNFISQPIAVLVSSCVWPTSIQLSSKHANKVYVMLYCTSIPWYMFFFFRWSNYIRCLTPD